MKTPTQQSWFFFHLRLVLLLGITSLPCCALAAVIEDFESATPTWQPLEGDAPASRLDHKRIAGNSHLGASSELIALRFSQGSYAYYGQRIKPARVVPDLSFSIWVKSDRPGIQFAVQVVFPRSRDPRTGQPITTRILGDRSGQPDQWNQIGIRNIDEQVSGQVTALRSEHGAQFDPREAYVDMVLLNLYTGTGIVRVQIDDLNGEGLLNVQKANTVTQRVTNPGGLRGMGGVPGTTGANVQLAPPRSESASNGQVIELNDHAAVPRIIDYNGEPLSLLRGLGFNAIRTSRAPSPQLQQELLRYNMWSVSSPPETRSPADQSAVLAWELPIPSGDDAFSDFAIRAADLRLLDGQKPRPVLAIAPNRVHDYSQHSEIIATRRSPLGTSQSLTDYAKWTQSWGLFASPSATRWAVIPTQFSPATQRQVSFLAQEASVPMGFQPYQLEKATFLAIANGVRGIVFESNSPLNEDHPVDFARRTALDIINRRMELIYPWIAQGSPRNGAISSDPNVHVSMLATDTAILLIAVRTGPDDQFVVDPLPDRPVDVRVRGVPMASEAYRIGDSGIHSVNHSRGLGDMKIQLDASEHVSLVFLTQDPRVIRNMRERSERHRTEIVRLRMEAVNHEFELARSVQAALESPAESPAIRRNIDSAWADIRQARTLYEEYNLQTAYRYVTQAERKVATVQRQQWTQWASQYKFPLTNPTLISHDLVPFASRLQGNLNYLRPGTNTLPAGDMEDLTFLLSSGWIQVRSPQPGFESAVELSPQQPHGGNYALSLRVSPDTQGLYARPEQAPISVRSATVQVPPDRLVIIRGWIRIPQRLSSETGGVLIHDTLGGRELGIHMTEAAEWTEFSLMRATGDSDTLNLTVEMADVGQVFLDDVTVSIYEATRGPEIAPGFDAEADDRFQSYQP
ncbi:hypothetical protein [Bremerella alba]|uniref:Uncharacterized protein n=1 Tax=Bremerella alba TaxID=980252 RepID=A0A7V9A6X7_9BACT|nr:hypothetical protein [Bremerella alba]MBA2114737.1 hypothetical protein [Bremerella alba]